MPEDFVLERFEDDFLDIELTPEEVAAPESASDLCAWIRDQLRLLRAERDRIGASDPAAVRRINKRIKYWQQRYVDEGCSTGGGVGEP